MFTFAEGGAVAGVEVAFDGRRLGEQHGVRREFEVLIFHGINAFLRNRGAVDEPPGRHQRAIEMHGMVRRESEGAGGAAFPRTEIFRCAGRRSDLLPRRVQWN